MGALPDPDQGHEAGGCEPPASPSLIMSRGQSRRQRFADPSFAEPSRDTLTTVL
jgi:hypothetical protein